MMCQENLKNIYDSLPLGIIILDEDLNIILLNKWFEKYSGYKTENLCNTYIGNTFSYFDKKDFNRKFKILKNINIEIEYSDDSHINFYFPLYDKENKEIKQKIYISSFNYEKHKYYVMSIKDYTREKQLEDKLKIEKENYFKLNDTLNFLIDKMKTEKNVSSFIDIKVVVNQIVLPLLNKIKKTTFTNRQAKDLSLIENNLINLFNEDGKRLVHDFNLSSTELQVLELIKYKYSTKEIASILNVCQKTVDTHRYNIRKKLDIPSQKISIIDHIKKI